MRALSAGRVTCLQVDLIGFGFDSGFPYGVGALAAINEFYRRDVPLGAYKGRFGREVGDDPGWVTGPYVTDLVETWNPAIQNSSQVPDAVTLYRRALVAQHDHAVVIAAIGFPTNIAALLRSPPDEISPLNGSELVAKKVRQVVWQGGLYARWEENSESFNWNCGDGWYRGDGCAGSAAVAVNEMPPNVDQVYSDLGEEVWTGGKLGKCAP
eukprot:2312925-Prymnesium_polylepis.1